MDMCITEELYFNLFSCSASDGHLHEHNMIMPLFAGIYSNQKLPAHTVSDGGQKLYKEVRIDSLISHGPAAHQPGLFCSNAFVMYMKVIM